MPIVTHMHFHYIGGKFRTPLSPSLLQTDGSYRAKIGRVAALLRHANMHYTHVETMPSARNSYETEWCSVYKGLLFALETNVTKLHIENDNLSVIQHLVGISSKDCPSYVAHYKHNIRLLANQTEYTGVRWIPRRFNRADDLFHKVRQSL
jgi:hypothetical protein